VAHDARHAEPASGVDASLWVQIEAATAGPEAGHPDGSVRRLEHEIPAPLAGRRGQVSVEIRPPKASHERDALAFVVRRVEGDRAYGRLHRCLRWARRFHEHGEQFPRSGPLPSEDGSGDGAEIRSAQAAVVRLQAPDVPEAASHLEPSGGAAGRVGAV